MYLVNWNVPGHLECTWLPGIYLVTWNVPGYLECTWLPGIYLVTWNVPGYLEFETYCVYKWFFHLIKNLHDLGKWLFFSASAGEFSAGLSTKNGVRYRGWATWRMGPQLVVRI